MIAGILLAAGHSRRFGAEDKLQQPLADGQWMAVAVAGRLQQVLPASLAVVQASATPLQTALRSKSLHCVSVPMPDAVMSDSLKWGLRAAQQQWPMLSGIVVMLADMPDIQSETIRAVSAHLSAKHPIVQPRYQAKPGHPVGLHRSLFGAVMQVTGDQGARGLLQQYAHAVLHIDVDDAGVLRDIDTPAQLAQYLSGHRLI